MDYQNDIETFKLALEDATNHIVFTDVNGKIDYANRGAEIVTGFSKEEMIGKTPRLWGGLMSKSFYEKLWKTIKIDKKPFKSEIKNKRKNGEIYYALLNISPILGQNQELIGFISTEEDISRIKNLSTQLEEQESFLRKVIDTVPHFLFAKDWDGKFTLANKAVATVYGTTPEGLLGKSDADFNKNKKEVEHFLHDDREVMTTEKPKIVAEEPVTNSKTGETHWYQTVKVPLILRNKPKQILGVSTDITIRKNFEEMIKIEKKKDEAILESIGDGLIATDKDGNISLMNRTAEKLLGWKFEELKGQKMVDLIPVLNEQLLPIMPNDRALVRTVTSRKPVSVMNHYYVRKDKSQFPISAIVTPIYFNDAIIGTIEVFRDITKELEADRAKTEFVSIAAHQLRAPLTSVSWHTELMMSEKDKLPKKTAEYIEEINLANKRMTQLVDSLLNVSRIELGTFVYKAELIDLKKIINEIINEIKPDMDRKKLVLKLNFDKNEIKINTDPNLIRIIFQNLLTNSVKYSFDESEIKLDVKSKNGLLLKLTNHGIGIDDKDKHKIFTKFFRGDKAKMIDSLGNGLGLYIAKSMIKRVKGKIWFETRGNETTFYVSLGVIN